MDTSSNLKPILEFYHKNPHQYMSLLDIVEHVVEPNTWSDTHTPQHQQVQVVIWPHYRQTLESEFVIVLIPPCIEI